MVGWLKEIMGDLVGGITWNLFTPKNSIWYITTPRGYRVTLRMVLSIIGLFVMLYLLKIVFEWRMSLL